MDDDNPVTDDKYITKSYSYTDDDYQEEFQLVYTPFTDDIVEFNKGNENDINYILDCVLEWYYNYLK